MKGPCEDCAHYRPACDLTEIYRIPLTKGTAQVAQTVVDVQRQLYGSEEVFKGRQMLNDNERWPSKPQVQSYCGLREATGDYLLHQIKNLNRRCNDWEAAHETPPHPCSSCVHHRAASGPARDSTILLDVVSPGNFYHPSYDGSARPNVSGDVDRVIEVSQQQQSHETLMALHGAGVLPKRPEYFAWCQQYSTSERYVLCATQNPHRRCGGWSDGRPTGRPGGSAAQESRPESSRGRPPGRSGAGGSTFFATIARASPRS